MNQRNNFLELLSPASSRRLLSTEEEQLLQEKLWDALAAQANSFMLGASSSVREETARELFQSLVFLLHHGVGFRQGTVSESTFEAFIGRLMGEALEDLVRAGLRAVGEKVTQAEALLKCCVATAVPIPNLAYQDTLRELAVFFKKYHYHHFAHQIPCMIDYPLAQPVSEALLGVDYIQCYLEALVIENDFLGRFNPETVIQLLRRVTPSYQEDLLSLYETVAANALALTLLDADPRHLDVTRGDRQRLNTLLRACPEKDLPQLGRETALKLLNELSLDEAAAKSYLCDTAVPLFGRLGAPLTDDMLRQVFPPLYMGNGAAPKPRYIDNPPMENEALRQLLETMRGCQSLDEKIRLATESLKSLRDWAEVLNVSFWGEELDRVLSALTPDEVAQLRLYAVRRRQRAPEWHSETGWEDHFLSLCIY